MLFWAIWSYSERFRAIWSYLGIFGAILSYLELFGVICIYLDLLFPGQEKQGCRITNTLFSQNNLKMSDPSNLNMEGSMLAQCLAFSRQMESNKKSFKLEVKLSSGFSFNFNTLDHEESKSRTKEVKKKSPSTLRRNAARKQKFLDKKNTSSANKELSEDSKKCDQCDYQANCKVSLRKHVGKKHLVISQIDGLEDVKPSEEKSSQTEVQVKHSFFYFQK